MWRQRQRQRQRQQSPAAEGLKNIGGGGTKRNQGKELTENRAKCALFVLLHAACATTVLQQYIAHRQIKKEGQQTNKQHHKIRVNFHFCHHLILRTKEVTNTIKPNKQNIPIDFSLSFSLSLSHYFPILFKHIFIFIFCHLGCRCELALHGDQPLVHLHVGLLTQGHLSPRRFEEGDDVSPLAPDHQAAGREWNEHALHAQTDTRQDEEGEGGGGDAEYKVNKRDKEEKAGGLLNKSVKKTYDKRVFSELGSACLYATPLPRARSSACACACVEGVCVCCFYYYYY